MDVRGEGDGEIEGDSWVSSLSNLQENESIYSDKKDVGVRTELRWNKGMRGKINGVQEMKTRLGLVGQCVGK